MSDRPTEPPDSLFDELFREAAGEGAPKATLETPAKAPASPAGVVLLRPPTSGGFKPGNDPRRAQAPKRYAKAKRSMAENIRVATEDLKEQIRYLVDLSAGRIEDATHRERLDAVKVLLDRTLGKPTETVVNSDESAEDPLAGLTAEEIRELARKHAKR
jgi:hypothetical protein